MKILVESSPFAAIGSFASYGARADAMRQLLADVLKLHQAFGLDAPIAAPGTPDAEDWIEDLCRRRASLKAAAALGLGATLDAHGERPLLDLRTHQPRTEWVARRPDLFSAPRQVPYALSPAFAKHAGRRILLASNDQDDQRFAGHPPLEEAFRQLREELPGKALYWKQATGLAKEYPVARIEPDEGLSDDIRLAAVHLGGLSLLQEAVPMGFETRIFVVDGEPVSAAGCIEQATPFERPMDPIVDFVASRLQTIRNRRITLPYPTLAGQIAMEARRIVAAIAEEEPDFPRSYVLDLFVNRDTGGIGVIEMNPLNASGLYANDVDAIMPALARQLSNLASTSLAPAAGTTKGAAS